jgi:AAA domain
VPLEVGFAGVACAKTRMLQSYEELMQLLAELVQAAQRGQLPPGSTVIFDTGTAMERHIHDYVLRLDPVYANNKKTVTMESAHGGYGKAYNMANAIFDGVLKQLDLLAVYGGLNIVITCHVFSSKISDPTVGEYDSWDLLLHSPKNQKTYGKREMITQWADVIGFLYEPVFLMTGDKQTMTRGVSANKGRVLAVSRTPSYTAGNRFGMVGELTIPAPPANGWNSFADALYKTSGIDVFTR